jgi:hypothetical protein
MTSIGRNEFIIHLDGRFIYEKIDKCGIMVEIPGTGMAGIHEIWDI